MEFFRLAVLLFLICTPKYCASSGVDPTLQLELVHVLTRHGDRNMLDPKWSYPDDPYRNESYWPEGYAQLSKLGKQQHYALGQWFRTRYSKFLSEAYSLYDIYVESSDVDRTIMSAQANLAGLYPPNGTIDPTSVWNEALPWQPIPVHTIPKDFDNKLQLSAPCPRASRLISDYNNGPETIAILSENAEMFAHFANNTGRPIRNLADVHFLYDPLLIKSIHNYSLPAWSEGYFPGGQLFNLTSMSFRVWTWNDELKRLKGGPMIKEVVQHFQEKVQGVNYSVGQGETVRLTDTTDEFEVDERPEADDHTDGARKLQSSIKTLDKRMKFFMSSGHDTTISSVLNSLGVWNGLPPPYASAVMFELKRKPGRIQGDKEAYFVEIYYRNETGPSDPNLLTIPGCAASCRLDKFVELTRSAIPLNWEWDCIDASFTA